MHLTDVNKNLGGTFCFNHYSRWTRRHLSYPDDRGSSFLWNAGVRLPEYGGSQCRRL